jgi:hypothetical protein
MTYLRRYAPWAFALVSVALLFQCLITGTTANGLLLCGDKYDAGALSRGQIVSHDFVFWNLSSRPILIASQPGCGCTATDEDVLAIPAYRILRYHASMRAQGEGSTSGVHERNITFYCEAGKVDWQEIASFRYVLKGLSGR